MSISDWSSDVCSSDLPLQLQRGKHLPLHGLLNLLQLHRPARDRGCENPRRRAVPDQLLCRLRCHHWRRRNRHSSWRSEHTSELQSLMRISYAVFCLKKKKHHNNLTTFYTKLLCNIT